MNIVPILIGVDESKNNIMESKVNNIILYAVYLYKIMFTRFNDHCNSVGHQKL